MRIADRFRGFLPVVVDVETAGFNAKTDALLECAATLLVVNDRGQLQRGTTLHHHIVPFKGANLEPSALEFTGIDPYHPFRLAVPEHEGLLTIFKAIRKEIKATQCQRAVLVGHNPIFDLSFIQACVDRNNIKRNPFHPFTTFDTATLGGIVYGQTVLAKAVEAAGLTFDTQKAHSALYDAEITADLFCTIVNQFENTFTGNNTR